MRGEYVVEQFYTEHHTEERVRGEYVGVMVDGES